MEVNYKLWYRKTTYWPVFTTGQAIYNRRIKQWQQVNVPDGLKSDYLDVPVFSFTNGTNPLVRKKNPFVFANADPLQQTAFLSTHISSQSINGGIPVWVIAGLYQQGDFALFHPGHTDWVCGYRLELSLPHSIIITGLMAFIKKVSGCPGRTQLFHWQACLPVITFPFYAITNDGVKTGRKNCKINITPPFIKPWFVGLLSLAVTAHCCGGLPVQD